MRISAADCSGCLHPNSLCWKNNWWWYCIDCGRTFFEPKGVIGLDSPKPHNIRCYIAGALIDGERLREARRLMEAAGWEVTSRWLDGDGLTGDYRIIPSEAKVDYSDIDRAQAVIIDTQTTNTRGGREWEGGYATGTGKLVYVVGPARTPFHTTVLRRFDSWEECANVLRQN